MQDSQSRVGIVVVNWNNASDTLIAYKSLKLSTFEHWWLYVVDNASEDRSSEILGRKLGEKSTLILNNINSGFSGGCNIGIQHALSEKCTHVFLLNNDATVLPSTIMSLIDESMHLNDKAILGCVVQIYGTDRLQFFGSRTRDDVGHPIWFDEKDSEKLSQNLIVTDFVLGAALFAPAQIWQEVGHLDEKFYLNYEETDWCYRARKIGFPCYIVPASVIMHKVGATIGPMGGPMQIYFLSRNELLFASHHATTRQKSTLLFRTIKVLIRSIIRDFLKFRLIKPTTIAHAIALYDFSRGKFGDCPAIIRKLSLTHSAAYQVVS